MPYTQRVTITSDPQATISIDNKVVGTGQVSLDLMRNRDYSVLVSSYGKVESRVIGRRLSVAGFFDAIGTGLFIVPVIGVFGPGFTDLWPTEMAVYPR